MNNQMAKSALKTTLKKFDTAVAAGDKAEATVAYTTAVKAVDQAAAKHLLHKNLSLIHILMTTTTIAMTMIGTTGTTMTIAMTMIGTTGTTMMIAMTTTGTTGMTTMMTMTTTGTTGMTTMTTMIGTTD